MVRHAIFCGMWAVWLIPTVVVLISLLLASLPPPGNVEQLIGHGQESGVHRRFQALLGAIASLSFGPRARYTTLVVVGVGIWAVWTASQIKIGNPVEGSGLLWDESEFNTAVRQINRHFPGVNTLEIVLEAKNRKSAELEVQKVETIETMLKLQRLLNPIRNCRRVPPCPLQTIWARVTASSTGAAPTGYRSIRCKAP